MIYHWYPLIIIRDIHGTVPTCTNCDSIHRRPGAPPPEPPQCSASSRALGPLLQRADLNVVERYERCCGWATLPEFHGIWDKSEAGFQQTRLGGELNIPVYTSLKSVQAQYRYISFLCLGCIAHQFWNFSSSGHHHVPVRRAPFDTTLVVETSADRWSTQ